MSHLSKQSLSIRFKIILLWHEQTFDTKPIQEEHKVEVEDYINDPKMLRNVNLSYFEVNADNDNDTGIRLLTKG